ILLVISAVTSFLFLFIPSLPNSAFGNADSMWLRARDVERVEQILKQDRTITDEEMRDIATRQLRNVLEGSGKRTNQVGWTRQKAFVGIPLLTILVCAAYLVLRCYPSAVFLWGDEVERYNNMLQ